MLANFYQMFQKQNLLFSSLKENLNFNMKIMLNGKRLYPTDSVKYFGVKIDNELNWKSDVNATSTKLNRENAMLYNLRDFVDASIFKSIYYTLP